MNPVPRVVILTGDGPEHLYVANRIAAAVPVVAMVQLGQPRKHLKSLFGRGLVSFVDRLLLRAFLVVTRDARRRERTLNALFGKQRATLAPPIRTIKLDHYTTASLAETVRELDPDILAVYGTAKIPDPVLVLARTIALNMHTGISPYYRGTACAFWPIVRGEPEMVGATVHQCTSAMDGGQIYFTGRAELTSSDNLHDVFGRAVLVGAAGYADVVRAALAGPLSGVPQDLSIGREYRGYMRGLRAELTARWNLMRMRGQWPSGAAKPAARLSRSPRP